jgi:pimeloyl-ACP methyl ester carboxylesterase
MARSSCRPARRCGGGQPYFSSTVARAATTSYFKPHFARLTDVAQVVYLDFRDHGRSSRQDPRAWTLEACADDVRAFCDTLGIDRPIVLGHSFGGFVAISYGARHPGHAGGLILASTMARFVLDRLVAGFRGAAGDEVAELARRDYSGDSVTEAEWDRVFAAFGPNVPDAAALARRIRNPAVGAVGMEIMRTLNLLDALPRIASPTLVCVGSLDPVTPVDASREIVDGLAPGIGELEVFDGAGHFLWLDDPDGFFGAVSEFVQRSTSDGINVFPTETAHID